MKNTMKLNLNNIINNKYVLYLVALIALLDIIGYIMRQEFSAVLFFYLVGMITYFYTKNMTIVLGTSLLVTTLAHLIKNMIGIKEGLENETEEVVEEEVETGEKNPEKEKVTKRLKLQEKESGSKEKAIKKAFEKTDVLKDLEIDKKSEENLDNVSKDANAILKDLQKKGIKSGYQNKQKLTPGLYNIPNKTQLEKQLGEADKIEAAYDNLEQVIGENGIKSMSDSTKELVRQQNELLKGLKDITPALHEAMGAIGKIDLGGLKQMFSSTSSALSKE
tara:strand:- start:508 stop:1338 length:831 start_codon:yes stop_codon:yes gene_type:complete